MGEISLEADTVNKFINSLSKSIQALCHGCMDFNNSIEMVGYININIDSSNIVDCVLNEKVRRSAANSMTCVSNSFHAKKEKQKQTKDASCSPVRHPEPRVQHSPMKRQFGQMSRDMPYRGTVRKRQRFHQRPSVPAYDYYGSENAYSSQSSSHALSHSQSAPYNTYQEQSSTHLPEIPSIQQQIKTEVAENAVSDSAASAAPEISVKKETDLPKSAEDENTESSTVQSGIEEPAGSSYGADENDINSQVNPDEPTVTAGEFASGSGVRSEKTYEGEATQSDSNLSNSFLGAQDDFNEAGSQIQPPPDCREDSMDDSQFEVIEIGDEDEDVKGMFDQQPEVNRLPSSGRYAPTYGRIQAGCSNASQEYMSPLHEDPSRIGSTEDNSEYPFNCHICNKGFFTTSGLNLHVTSHSGRQFSCEICDKRFYQKSHLTVHLKKVHQCIACRSCQVIFRIDEFHKHVLKCP